MRDTLFRAEALAPKNDGWMGEVVLVQPLSLRAVVWMVVALTAALFLFLCRADYTRRIDAGGALVPDMGLVKVQSPRAGVVLQCLVREGQQVQAGQLLYVVSTDVAYLPDAGSGAAAGVAADALQAVRERQQLLDRDVASNAAVAGQERAELAARVRSLQDELAQLAAELAIQRERLQSREAQFERYQQAHQQGFLSPLGLQQKYDEVLDQRARVQAMGRSRLGLERELAAARAALATAGGKADLSRSQLQREALEARRAAGEQAANRRVAVVAPGPGVVAALLAEPGQRVDGDTLLTLLPRGARLEAQLLLPPKAIGFVQEGDPVDLRVSAFPNRGGGKFRGVVTQVSRTALSAAEQARQQLASAASTQAPRYRVRVGLPAQELVVDGARRPLRAGMEVSASFPQERKTLMQWLLVPLARAKEAT